MTVTSAVVDVLQEAGVTRVYTVPGESAVGLLDALGQSRRVEVISARHESGAGFMADAEAKLTGRPAAVLVNRAVGAANASIAVHTARQDSTPMLVLLAQAESAVLGREAFQEADLAAFYRPIAKWVGEARRAERTPDLVRCALSAAVVGRPGPAAAVVPADYWTAPVERSASPPTIATCSPPDSADIAEFADALARAQAPVAIVGGGGRGAWTELVAFAERYGAGVYTAWRRQDTFPNDHPAYLGHLGIGTDPRLLGPLRQADLVLALGTRLGEITTQGYTLPAPCCRVAQIDIEPGSIGATVPVELAMVSDVRHALRGLLELPVAVHRDWSAGHRTFLESSTPTDEPSGEGVHPAEVVAAMRDVLQPDTILTNDAGNFSGFLHRYWRYTRERTQLAPTSGAMGYAVPAAAAAKLVAGDRPVVAVVGDGGFLMTGHELETAVRYGAPIVCLVFRNGLYGSIATQQLKGFGRMTGVDIAAVDLAAYATSVGAVGFTVREVSELRPALEAASASGACAVVDVVTDPDVLTPVDRARDLASEVIPT